MISHLGRERAGERNLSELYPSNSIQCKSFYSRNEHPFKVTFVLSYYFFVVEQSVHLLYIIICTGDLDSDLYVLHALKYLL